MAVAIQDTGTTTNAGTTVTTFDFPITSTSGSDLLVLQFVAFESTSPTGITCYYDPLNWNEEMTLITTTDLSTNYKIQIYGRLAPHVVGSTKCTVSWTNASDIGGLCMILSGVKQTTLGEAVIAATPTSGTSNTASITISSATGNMTFDIASVISGWWINPTQTQYAEFGAASAFGSYASGAASVTHQWTTNDSGSRAWAQVGINVVAVGGGGGGADGLMWLA